MTTKLNKKELKNEYLFLHASAFLTSARLTGLSSTRSAPASLNSEWSALPVTPIIRPDDDDVYLEKLQYGEGFHVIYSVNMYYLKHINPANMA
jgi:hypothetical protein